MHCWFGQLGAGRRQGAGQRKGIGGVKNKPFPLALRSATSSSGILCGMVAGTQVYGYRSYMSQHRSLRAAAALGAKRNVLKRYERVELLKKRGQWKDGDRVTGLRKTKPGS